MQFGDWRALDFGDRLEHALKVRALAIVGFERHARSVASVPSRGESSLPGSGIRRHECENFCFPCLRESPNVRSNMEELTERQQEVLGFIEESLEQTGVMPSTREIQEHFGFASQTAAVNHLRALEKKGVIQRYAGKARAMALVSSLKRDTIMDVPIYGQIAAGMAGFAEQEEAGMISVDASSVGVTKGKRVFALKVRGDSMIDAGINDGDLVILELQGAEEQRRRRGADRWRDHAQASRHFARPAVSQGRESAFPRSHPRAGTPRPGRHGRPDPEVPELSAAPKPAAEMIGFLVEFSIVVAAFLFVWRRQVRARRRARARASQLDFDFFCEHSRGA